jgi:hypothetical protein
VHQDLEQADLNRMATCIADFVRRGGAL